MKTHDLKTWPAFFAAVQSGEKTFEVRKNDRDFQPGDFLNLQEYDPERKEYSACSVLCEAIYVLHGPAFGIEAGFCVISLRLL